MINRIMLRKIDRQREAHVLEISGDWQDMLIPPAAWWHKISYSKKEKNLMFQCNLVQT